MAKAVGEWQNAQKVESERQLNLNGMSILNNIDLVRRHTNESSKALCQNGYRW
jgi:hypothetical protein